jgi:hypothetical protein
MKVRLLDLIQRKTPPAPWAEGETIPWNEPGFSERMLREHLSQEHDAASRRREKVQQQVRRSDSSLHWWGKRMKLRRTCS